jgi:hypothetical protein
MLDQLDQVCSARSGKGPFRWDKNLARSGGGSQLLAFPLHLRVDQRLVDKDLFKPGLRQAERSVCSPDCFETQKRMAYGKLRAGLLY